jgi:hypothetical protein
VSVRLMASLLLLASGAAWGRTTTYAIHVGNNAPPEGVPGALARLRYADDDAVRWFEFTSRFAEQSVLLSTLDEETQRRSPLLARRTQAPTWLTLKRVVLAIAVQVERDLARGDEPVVYLTFSGHGARDEQGVFFLALEGGGLRQRELYEELLMPLRAATVHLLIDACHAESLVSPRDGASQEQTMARVAVDPHVGAGAFEPRLPERFSRVGVLIATAVEQQAHEWSRIESGVFTHEVLSGLSGAADVNGDGLVEYSELSAFVASANREFSDPRAVPAMVTLPPRADLHTPLVRLTELRGTGTGVLQGRFEWGHFYVELENGRRVLDVHLEPGQVAKLYVPTGRLFIVAGEREATVMVAPQQTLDTTGVSFSPRRASARGSLEAALDSAFFRAAFSRAYYQGYVDSRREPSVTFEAPQGSGLSPGTAGAWVSTGSAFALALASICFSVAAGESYRAYQSTTLQRPAAEAIRDTNVFIGVAVGAGISALGLGVLSWMLWGQHARGRLDFAVGPSSLVATLRF